MLWWWQSHGRVTPIPPVIVSRIPVAVTVASINPYTTMNSLSPIGYVIDVDSTTATTTTVSPYLNVYADVELIRIL